MDASTRLDSPRFGFDYVSIRFDFWFDSVRPEFTFCVLLVFFFESESENGKLLMFVLGLSVQNRQNKPSDLSCRGDRDRDRRDRERDSAIHRRR